MSNLGYNQIKFHSSNLLLILILLVSINSSHQEPLLLRRSINKNNNDNNTPNEYRNLILIDDSNSNKGIHYDEEYKGYDEESHIKEEETYSPENSNLFTDIINNKRTELLELKKQELYEIELNKEQDEVKHFNSPYLCDIQRNEPRNSTLSNEIENASLDDDLNFYGKCSEEDEVKFAEYLNNRHLDLEYVNKKLALEKDVHDYMSDDIISVKDRERLFKNQYIRKYNNHNFKKSSSSLSSSTSSLIPPSHYQSSRFVNRNKMNRNIYRNNENDIEHSYHSIDRFISNNNEYEYDNFADDEQTDLESIKSNIKTKNNSFKLTNSFHEDLNEEDESKDVNEERLSDLLKRETGSKIDIEEIVNDQGLNKKVNRLYNHSTGDYIELEVESILDEFLSTTSDVPIERKSILQHSRVFNVLNGVDLFTLVINHMIYLSNISFERVSFNIGNPTMFYCIHKDTDRSVLMRLISDKAKLVGTSYAIFKSLDEKTYRKSRNLYTEYCSNNKCN